TYTLRWSITNGTCAASTSNVTITLEQAPTVANAGADQNFCGTTVSLGANAPAVGTGAWSFAPGGNPDGRPLTAFSNTASRTSNFTGTPGQTYILRSTSPDCPCARSYDHVQIRLDQAPAPANAGTNQPICATATTLSANAPTLGTGRWTVTTDPAGLGVISDAKSATSLLTGTPGDTY